MTKRLTAVLAALLIWTALGGCPSDLPPGPDMGDANSPSVNDDGQGNDDGTAVSGTFAGQVSCHKTESAQGTPGPEDDWQSDVTFTITGNVPTQFLVPAYRQPDHGWMTFAVVVAEVGGNVEVTQTDGDYTATLTATVREANYDATGGHVVLDLEYHGIENTLTEDGTGTFTLDYTIDGDTVTYNAVIDYEVRMLIVDTTWTLTCTGTLTAQ